MERKQRVAKLEALLARVQSRSNRGETHGNAAVAMPQPAAAATVARIAPVAAPVAAPVVQAAPQIAAATPKPSPVAASAPPVQAEPARPAMVAHEMQEEVATVVRDVPPEALAAIATAIAQQKDQDEAKQRAAAPPQAAPSPAAAAAAPAASMAPAFRGTSAFGGLSKKMTLIGTAPPANWPPRGAEQSVPPPEPAASAAPVADPQTVQEPAPEIQATESEGDLDALLGDESSSPPAAVEERAPEPGAATPAPNLAQSVPTEPAKRDQLPIVSASAPLAEKKPRSATTVIAMILLWLILIAAIWFVYKSSM